MVAAGRAVQVHQVQEELAGTTRLPPTNQTSCYSTTELIGWRTTLQRNDNRRHRGPTSCWGSDIKAGDKVLLALPSFLDFSSPSPTTFVSMCAETFKRLVRTKTVSWESNQTGLYRLVFVAARPPEPDRR